MPKAKKLPSGSWRCRVMVNGKSHSITVDDPSPAGRRRCEQLAADYAAGSRQEASKGTVSDALGRYIQSREGLVSVTTLRSYRDLSRTAYAQILHLPLDQLTDNVVQKWIKTYSEGRSPKTVRNAYSLLCSAAGRTFDVVLPERRQIDYYTPTDEDVKAILAASKDTDLERAILLAAFGTLREGEICALTVKDFTEDTVTISKSMAWTGNGYVIKKPKTVSSIRTVSLPENIIEKIVSGKTDRIVEMHPRQLSQTFTRALKKAGLPVYRFHDLRAYAASVRHALGIPDQYIMADGGWRTDHILKTVYRRAMDDKRKEFSKISGEHFKSMV